MHQLGQLDVERRLALGQRLHRGLHALHVAAVIGAPDIDQVVEAAAELVVVVGDVAGEIGPRPIGFFQRPIDLVAELGGAEQRLRPRLPILRQFAFRGLQHALVDQPALAERGERRIDRTAGHQVALGDKGVELHAEHGEIGADQSHHLGDGEFAHRRQPNRLGLVEPLFAVALEQLASGLLQVFAGIEPLRLNARRLQRHRAVQQAAFRLRFDRLAIAVIDRAGQRIDLGAGIVDVILTVHRKASLGEQCRERVADDGAAAMADMHRPGRVGRDKLDIDPLAAADRRIAIGRPGGTPAVRR